MTNPNEKNNRFNNEEAKKKLQELNKIEDEIISDLITVRFQIKQLKKQISQISN